MDPIRKFAERIERLEKNQRKASSTPQLGTSSIEDGTLLEYDSTQTLVGAFGKQVDGTHTQVSFNGPVPPAPTVPTISLPEGAVRVSWDGEFSGSAVAPLDFARIDVHVYTVADGSALGTPSRASIMSQGWGDISVPLTPATYRAALVTWTQSGKYAVSEPSAEFTVNAISASPSDGFVPATAPVVVASQFAIGAVQFNWAAVENADPVEYHVFASLTSPVAANPLVDVPVGRVSGTKFLVTDIDGMQIPVGVNASPVYAVVIPKDDDGFGPASAEVSASARAADNEYISALYAYLGTVEASQITTGTLDADVLWAGIQNVGPINGRHIEIDPAKGLTLYGSDGATPIITLSMTEAASVFRGRIEADQISVLNGLELLGTASKILSGSGMTVDAGVANPSNTPTLGSTTITTLSPGESAGVLGKGVHWSVADSRYYRVAFAASTKTMRVRSFTGDFSTSTINFTTTDGLDFVKNMSGCVKYGSYIYSCVDELFGDGLYRWRIARWHITSGLRHATLFTASGNSETTGVPALGLSPTNEIMYVYTYTADGFTYLFKVDAGLVALSSGGIAVTTLTPGPMEWRSVGEGSYDFGSNKFYMAEGKNVWFLNDATWPAPGSPTALATQDTSKKFTVDTSVVGEGLAYKDSGTEQGFYSFAGDGLRRKWSSYYPAVAGERFWATYLNKDSASGKTTRLSDINTAADPAVAYPESEAIPARWWPSAILPPKPSGVDAQRIFTGYGANKPTAYYERPEVAGTVILTSLRATTGAQVNIAVVGNKALTSNVATLTTAMPHGFTVGQGLAVTGVGSPFDGDYVVASVPTTTTVTYARSATNVTSVAATGRAENIANTFGLGASGWVATALGGFLLNGDGSVKADLMRPIMSKLSGDLTSNTTATYVPLTNGSGPVFVAPLSGTATVSLSIVCRTLTSGNPIVCGYEVRAGSTVGSGTVFQAASELVTNGDTNYARSGGTDLLVGMTPGSTYNIRAMFLINTAGATAQAARATIVVSPCL